MGAGAVTGSPRERAKRDTFTQEQNKCILEAGRAVQTSTAPRRFEEAWKRLQLENRAGLGVRSQKELAEQWDYLVGEARRLASSCA